MAICKTRDLIGPALDWAVAAALGKRVRISTGKRKYLIFGATITEGSATFAPHRRWDQGASIIEHAITKIEDYGDSWGAEGPNTPEQYGPTILIAVMRCYVTSKLGDEVEIPEELA